MSTRMDKMAVVLDGHSVRVMLGRSAAPRPDVDFSLCLEDAHKLAESIVDMLFAATAGEHGSAS